MMSGRILGERRRTFVRAFGPAGADSLTNHEPCEASEIRRSASCARSCEEC